MKFTAFCISRQTQRLHLLKCLQSPSEGSNIVIVGKIQYKDPLSALYCLYGGSFAVKAVLRLNNRMKSGFFLIFGYENDLNGTSVDSMSFAKTGYKDFIVYIKFLREISPV